MNVGPIPGTFEPGFVEPRMEERSPEQTKKLLPRSRGLRCFGMGECAIIIARENPAGGDTFLWHLTISCLSRHPSWDEVKTARYRLLPLDICMGMLLPPPELYVNVPQQDHVFQLWEIQDPHEPWKED